MHKPGIVHCPVGLDGPAWIDSQHACRYLQKQYRKRHG